MKRLAFLSTLALLLNAGVFSFNAHATTLAPELKAYDFARAYYIEDGGVVIAPREGFYCPDGVETPEGIRVMPGQTFIQFDEGKLIMEVYHFTRLDADGRRAFFHERRYHYKVVKNAEGKFVFLRDGYIDSDDFYLTRFRGLEWFDFAFPGLDIQPGEQYWRSRP